MLRTVYLLFAVVAALAAAAEERRINVSSDEVEYNADNTGAVFRGNVEISAGGLTLWAATLHVQNEDGRNSYVAHPAGNTPLSVVCGDCAAYVVRAEIGEKAVFDGTEQRLQLAGGISLCADDGCRQGNLHAAAADWYTDKQELLLTGAPIVSGSWLLEEDSAPMQLQAEQIRYHFARNEAVLTGDARLTRGDSDITGTRIEVNLKTGALRAEADADSRVQATFGSDD